MRAIGSVARLAGRLNLVQTFSILSLLCVVALSSALGFVATEAISRNMLDWEWRVTAEIVRARVRRDGLDRLFVAAAARQQPSRFRQALEPLLELPDVVRVKAWGPDASVLWSDDPGIIGKTFPDNPELRQALAGSVSAALEAPPKPDNDLERRRYGRLAEIYIPIADPDRGGVGGVLEVYKDADGILDRIDAVRTTVWSVCLAGGLVLYVSLFWILLVSERGQRRLERNLTRTLEELSAKNSALDRLYEDSQRALAELRHAQEQLVRGATLRALGQLSAGAAHHLNNLFAVVLGRLGLLLDAPQPAGVAGQLRLMEKAMLDAAEVVRRIHTFSRMQPVEDRQPLDLRRLVDDVVEMTRGRWKDEMQARGVTIDVIVEAEEVPPVLGNETSLRELLMNLVLNAIDALPAGGRITLGLRAEPDGVRLTVADTGVGMAPEIRRRALEPFFTTKGVRSTGLGLSVGYGIVQRHGGELEIRSAEGRGTVVMVRLPFDGAPAGSRPVEEGAGAPPPARPLRALVIDDEPLVRETVGTMLQRLGHAALTAASGPEGLALLEAGERVDLVLTDLGMPGMTGLEVMRRIRARWGGLPVRLVTGWADAERMVDVDPVFRDAIVYKPLTLDALRVVIAEAVAARA